MSARDQIPAAESAMEAAYKRDRALLRALYTAQQVEYRGKNEFIKCVTVLDHGGPETTVYLTGNPEPVNPDELKPVDYPK